MSKATKIISFIGLTIAMFMGTLDSTIVNIALPKIMTQNLMILVSNFSIGAG